MNPRKTYKIIVENAKRRDSDSITGEWHHIKPKCIGGLDDAKNLVKLTFREHYFCHYLLMKIHSHNKSLSLAFVLMSEDKKHGKVISSREYERCKQLNLEYKSEYMSKYMNNEWSNETKKKQRLININKQKCLYSMWKYLCTYNVKPTRKNLLQGWKIHRGFSTAWKNYWTESEWLIEIRKFLKINPIDTSLIFNKKQSNETVTKRNKSIILHVFINRLLSNAYGKIITKDIILNCKGANGKKLLWYNHYSEKEWIKTIKNYWKENNSKFKGFKLKI